MSQMLSDQRQCEEGRFGMTVLYTTSRNGSGAANESRRMDMAR
jgi:hypothetical protein